MVVSRTAWVRPAQALVYTESGEVRLFPPRNRGNLPRALTFRDHQEWSSAETRNQYNIDVNDALTNEGKLRLTKTDVGTDATLSSYSEDNQLSFLIATNTSKDDIDDPPEEYGSFLENYSQWSKSQERNLFMDNSEAPSMSTPTEQYSNLLRHKKSELSPLVASPRNVLETTQDNSSSGHDCNSPLIHTDPNTYISLDDLVELYSRRMREARLPKETSDEDTNSAVENANVSPGDLRKENCSNLASLDVPNSDEKTHNQRLEEVNDFHCHLQEENIPSETPVKFCNSMRLTTLDIRLLLEEIDLIIRRDPQSTYQDFTCIKPQDLESLIINCQRKPVEFIMLE